MAYVTSDAAERRRAWSVIAMAVISAMLWAIIIESARLLVILRALPILPMLSW